jgi:hypothetical protein
MLSSPEHAPDYVSQAYVREVSLAYFISFLRIDIIKYSCIHIGSVIRVRHFVAAMYPTMPLPCALMSCLSLRIV